MRSNLSALREYVPLKQGLRHTFFEVMPAAFWLREYVPLKQGLRPQRITY